MLTKIRRMGHSRGLLIPKPLLEMVGIEEEAEILVQGKTLVLRPPKRRRRSGWAEASKQIAARGADTLILPELANEFDAEWIW